MDIHAGKSLNKEIMKRLFVEMGDLLAAQGKTAEIAIFGGCALAISFDYRNATQDMDYMPIRGDISDLIQIAGKIGDRDGLSKNWFNDAVGMFASSENHELDLHGTYGEPVGLRVFIASPRYLFAMKCMALRSSLESSDPLDVWHLIDRCGFDTTEKAIAMVSAFYPNNVLPERNKLILMDLFDAKMSGEAYDPMLAWQP